MASQQQPSSPPPSESLAGWFGANTAAVASDGRIAAAPAATAAPPQPATAAVPTAPSAASAAAAAALAQQQLFTSTLTAVGALALKGAAAAAAAASSAASSAGGGSGSGIGPGTGGDVEKGEGAGAAPTASTAFALSYEGLSAGLGLLAGAASGAGSGAAAAAAATVPPAAPEWTCGLTYAQRFQAFLVLGCGSATLYIASFVIFLPMLLFAPAKFATSFTSASVMWLVAFALLWGPRQTLVSLLAPDKRAFTLAYVGSLGLSLYAALVSQSYFLIILAVLVQLTAAMWYSASYIPGGTIAAGALSRLCLSSARAMFASATR